MTQKISTLLYLYFVIIEKIFSKSTDFSYMFPVLSNHYKIIKYFIKSTTFLLTFTELNMYKTKSEIFKFHFVNFLKS